jgi:uncharacterized protein YdhG (YjbR/CyaY superfamily)
MIHSTKAENVDQYIATAPEESKTKLLQMRSIILKAAPKAEESIAYMMPAYKLNGVLVYFGGYKKHIGFYPTASGIENFKKELEGYVTSKGAIQFPLDKPLPTKLITQIVKFRALENLEKEKAKPKKK